MLTGEHPKYSFEQFLNVSQLLIFFFWALVVATGALALFFLRTLPAPRRQALAAHSLLAPCRSTSSRICLAPDDHPLLSFSPFLSFSLSLSLFSPHQALHVIAEVRTPPCGNIRRMNVEIPSLSVSDMRRLKATDHVGTYTLFQETYHRPTFKQVHVRGPKSDYDHRLLTHDRAMRAGLDDVGIGVLFGLADYRYEVLAMIQHAAHLEREYGAGPHTISVPRMRHAEGSDVSDAPPFPVDDANFKKLVAIIRIAVPYTGMILSTRESPEMRRELLKCGMSQMSAGSR